jgi:chemotaxis protein MotB
MVRLARVAAMAWTMMFLIGLVPSGCVPVQQYDALENDYNQLNQRLSGEIAAQQVHITRLQGAIKVAVNSELLFPSGGWQMPPDAAQTIGKMAPILAPFVQTQIIVTGYTDNVPIGPELRAQGVENNQQLSLKRAQTVGNYLISQGVNPNLVSERGLGDADPVAPNDTPQGRAQNRRVELTLAGPGT